MPPRPSHTETQAPHKGFLPRRRRYVAPHRPHSPLAPSPPNRPGQLPLGRLTSPLLSLLESISALLIGSVSLYLPAHAITTSMAPSRSILCPGETKSGLIESRVLNTAPMVWPLCFRGDQFPLLVPGSLNVPMSLDFAHPIAGMSRTAPTNEAMPSPLGWAMPWPSNMTQSGLVLRVRSVSIIDGPSLNESSPGMYGKYTALTECPSSTGVISGYL